MKNIQNDYINSVSLNSGPGFPYLVLDVINDQSYSEKFELSGYALARRLQFIYILDGEIKVKTLDTSVRINRGSGIFSNKFFREFY